MHERDLRAGREECGMRLPERKSKLDWERIDAVIQSAVKPLGSPRNENPLALDMGVSTAERAFGVLQRGR